MTTLLLSLLMMAAPGTPPAASAKPISSPASKPTSKPTSQPTSQPSPPRADEKMIDDAKLKFHFAVPKVWKPIPQQGDATIYVFSLPATGESRRYNPSLIITGRGSEGRTLAEEVDARRDAIESRNAGVKFDEDAAATLAGHDGWAFSYSTTLNQTVTEKPSGKQHQEQISLKVCDQFTMIDGRVLEFVITSDDKGMTIRRRAVTRLVATLVVDPE